MPRWTAPSPAGTLFDRLSDHAPFSEHHDGHDDYGSHEADGAGLDARESVLAELSRLFNTRRHRQPYLLQANVLDYGLPDWSATGSHNAEQQARLLRMIQSTIQQYEPRLRNVRVEAVENTVAQNAARQSARPDSIALRIRAELRHGNTPLSLSLNLRPDKPAEVAHERID
ncbi:MAG: type VI secretion system baseplate subunit TssE [Betaproteobacteria bacterium]|nr:type VI secretion system baseplate subunit TssE [Betaproteobacteria bacterium]